VKRQTTIIAAHILAVGTLAAFAACGGSSSPNGPGGPPSGGSPGPSGATITIANGRVTPSEVTITVGQSVTFVNNDATGHNVSSDPHPNHTDCPAINAVGNLGTGQTRATNALTSARVCTFHDHDLPDTGNLKGRITIQ
jgi:plastocyanin